MPLTLTGAGSVAAAWNPGDLGALLADEWVSGERQYTDSGATTPVTAAGQTVAAWVGVNGTKLTTTGGSMKALSVRGVLTPVSISDQESAWVVPGGTSVNQRDFAAWLHVQAGSGWLSGYIGLGSDRGVELLTYQDTRLLTFNAVGSLRYSALAPLASPCVLALEGAASTKYIRRNASEFDATPALPVGTASGGFIGAYNSAGSAGDRACAIYHGLCLTKSLDSTNRGLLLSYFDGRVSRPSDTAPALNIVALGDSNTCGTGAGGVSWPWLWSAASPSARIVSSSKSGQFFSAGGAPLNGATNTAQIDAEYRAGAGRNIIVIADTNDLGSISAASALSARESWAAARRSAGWEVWQPYLPYRVSPYSDAATYQSRVAAFNSALASSTAFDRRPDLYTASGGATPTAGLLTADGIHYTATMQQLVYTTLAGSL